MESSHNLEAPYPDAALTAARPWAARWLSIVFSPPLTTVSSLALAAGTLATPAAWAWALVTIGLALVVPMGYIAWLVARGEVSDYDLRIRAQRPRPYLMTTACGAASWLLLTLGSAPPLLTLLAGTLAVQAAVLMLITLTWKISLHTAAMASWLAVCLALFGSAAAPLAGLVLAVAWARVQLRRHTPWQTVAGALVGFLMTSASLAWLG